ncbi:hypothetical protein FSP39_012563 [Pinctada imbricata]|uniref:Large ribosomal subunit protein uL4m n=1 Tax=Pinctada imbricata TaxID=66713 RepID=A0AA88Y3B8_PINIB|nr:hypothetical protein FSP39_012563 [Pinctada imbricata]
MFLGGGVAAGVKLREQILKFYVEKRNVSTSCDNQQTSKATPSNIIDSQILGSRRALPVVTSREIQFPNKYREPKQAWLESLSQHEDEKLGLIDLHPDIFGAYPRIDVLHRNVKWQSLYRKINYDKTPSRAEVKGTTKKPWPQKGMGKARHGDRKSPLWVGGGKALGPRGPKSYFYMLPTEERVLGLCTALSVKYAQGYLQIVESLDIPTDDPQYLEDLFDVRFWGFSALFVDDTDQMPENIAIATSHIPQYNLMPVYGLNVYSMLKHETLVLTLAAVEKLEEKLLYQLNKTKLNLAFNRKDKYNVS